MFAHCHNIEKYVQLKDMRGKRSNFDIFTHFTIVNIDSGKIMTHIIPLFLIWIRRDFLGKFTNPVLLLALHFVNQNLRKSNQLLRFMMDLRLLLDPSLGWLHFNISPNISVVDL